MNTFRINKNTSFIMTVLNEAGSIGRFLDSLFKQTLMPAEIIVVDGGSKDKTADIITEYFKGICSGRNEYIYEDFSGPGRVFFTGSISLQDSISVPADPTSYTKVFEEIAGGRLRLAVFCAPGARISQGRNIAIGLSVGEFICVSDAGCRLEGDWLHEIARPYFEVSKSAAGTPVPKVNGTGPIAIEVVGGLTLPLAENFIQACLAVCMLPLKSEIKPGKFMPSSRNAGFTRRAWEDAGKYPEDMDFGEDMKFNFNIRQAGYFIKFNPDAKVYWNLRNSPAAVFRQFFRYAKGDAIGRMYPIRHLIRIVSLVCFTAIVTVSAVFGPYFLLLLAPFIAVYLFRPYLRINPFINDKKICPFAYNNKNINLLKAAIGSAIPFMLIYIDTAKLAGYIYGLFIRNIKRKRFCSKYLSRSA